MNIKVIKSAALALLLGGLALGNSSAALAAPAADTGREIKDAARALVQNVYPGFAIERIEISGAINNYATAVFYPDLAVNETDPGTVILRNDSGTWVGIGGPGTSFPDASSRAGAPDLLFDYNNPYTGQNAENSLNALVGAPVLWGSQRIQFDHPAAATVTVGNNITVLGPQVSGAVAYEITVTPLNESTNVLDEWGYDRMMRELQQRIDAAGPGARVAPPLFSAFYHLDNADVFQVDWLSGNAIERKFYLTAPGGGMISEVVTIVATPDINPAAAQAETAINLVLHTLRSAGPLPGMPTTGSEQTLLPILLAAGFVTLVAGLLLNLRRREETLIG